MQKKLIALAVAGLVSTGAFAQSTAVTVYGIADLSFDSVSTSGGTVANTKTGSYTRVSSNSSYIGFKGTEDLGNGLKALFQLETGVNVDAGGSASLFGNSRDSFAGLTGAFGTVVAGTLSGPTRVLGTQIDVNAGATSIGDNKGLINTSGLDTRVGNTVAYVSPSFGGAAVTAAYVSGENKTADNVAAALKKDTTGYDLGLTYNQGPILAGVTYGQIKNRDLTDSQVKNTRVAGAYDFGMASVRLLWNSTKNETTTTSLKQNVWGLGATFNAAPNGKIVAQYYKANDKTGNAVSNEGAKLFELGYEHSFSKRTMLKVIYARINNDEAAAFNFGTNAALNPAAGVDPSGFQIGIRHAF